MAPNGQPSPVLVTARGVTRRYGTGDAAVDALRGVDLDVAPGQFLAIMGPSGSGKSTLMHILAGLDRPSAGTVVIDGVEITSLNDRELTRLRRDKIGFVFQFFNLLPMLKADENIRLPLMIAGRRPDPAWEGTLIDAVGLRDRLHHLPSELSGGQQQRVAVARALLSQPAVVFGDEPTGNLDSKTSAEILQLLRHSVDEFGQTMVIVTHDALAASATDRVVFLEDGLIVRDEAHLKVDEILDTVKSLRS